MAYLRHYTLDTLKKSTMNLSKVWQIRIHYFPDTSFERYRYTEIPDTN
jgi:hypothetical protein